MYISYFDIFNRYACPLFLPSAILADKFKFLIAQFNNDVKSQRNIIYVIYRGKLRIPHQRV